MKRDTTLFPALILLLFLSFLFFQEAHATQTTLHMINFGGTYGHHYSPSTLTIEVGDTIVWEGDFSLDNMASTSVPAGASMIGPLTSGMSFMYVVEAAGTYYLENKVWASLGMRDTINAVFKPHGSLTNEGREFYLGLIYPTYNNIAPSSLYRQYAVYALITTYYDNIINYTYYDASGTELTPTKKNVAAHQRLQIQLSSGSMRADSFPEQQNVYKACHIVSKYPVTVQFLSRGANSTGSYLALPVLGLGKKYVVASYNDDATNGALVGGKNEPKTADTAGGVFLIIATQDVTNVNITPATTTAGGHLKGVPFSIGLSKGQCYYVRSDGKVSEQDISGTIIEASKPIVVISGHEDASIGDIPTNSEDRNMLIEQMIPVEYWDTTGYLGVPFAAGSPGPNTGGIGDGYRVYTYDAGTATVQADVVGIPGGYSLPTTPLNIAEHDDINDPADIYSTNGHKISVMQYDERSQTTNKPIPSPSMMTLVPHARWRNSYSFSEFDPASITGVVENSFVNVIADSLTTIRVSYDGSAEVPIGSTGFSTSGTYNSVSNHYNSGMKGARYTVGSHAYYLHSDYPFVCYTYGMNEVSYSAGGFGGGLNYEAEYSTPAGMQLNTGVPPSFKITVDTLSECSGWTVHVQDTGSSNPGVRAVILADDSAGIYFQRPATKFKNVSLDPSAADYTDGELHPFWESPQAYSFKVIIGNKLNEAIAPVSIIDNNGNGLLIQLHRTAPAVNLSTSPINSPNPDSIFFPQQKIGSQICTTFVVQNTAPIGGSPLSFVSARLLKGDKAYSIQSITPALPTQIPAQDSLTVQLCYSSPDSLRHQDTLLISNDCFEVPISLDAHSSTGLARADDIDFGNVDTGSEVCKTLMLRNIGSAPFTLMQSPKLSDTVNFEIDPAFLTSLPDIIQPGGRVSVKICFHPKLPVSDSARISWLTDIDPAYSGSGKNYSTLMGDGLEVPPSAVNSNNVITNSFSVRPNPISGNSAVISFALPGKQSAILTIYDLLGRAVYTRDLKQGIGQFILPISYLHPGIYQARLTSDDVVLTQKVEVLR